VGAPFVVPDEAAHGEVEPAEGWVLQRAAQGHEENFLG
jgi:hypothetical protein